MKGKLLLVFVQFFIFLLLGFAFLSKNALALTCTVTKPNPIIASDRNPSFTITAPSGFATGRAYDIFIYDNSHSDCPITQNSNCNLIQKNVPLTSGAISFNANSSSLITPFQEGTTYTVSVVPSGQGQPVCTATVRAAAPSSGSGGSECAIHFVNTDPQFNPGTEIKFNATGIDENQHRYAIYKGTGPSGASFMDGCTSGSGFSDISNPVSLGTLSGDTYYLQIRNGCSLFGGVLDDSQHPACYAIFTVGPNGGGVTSSGGNVAPGSPPIPKPPCVANSLDAKGCHKVSTAFGDIGTTSGSFVTSLLGVILSFAGGIAVLLIIIAGFRLISSQGNPEKIQAAREQLTAAVVGLIFIIFSLFILQIIGHDILNLPGFVS